MSCIMFKPHGIKVFMYASWLMEVEKYIALFPVGYKTNRLKDTGMINTLLNSIQKRYYN